MEKRNDARLNRYSTRNANSNINARERTDRSRIDIFRIHHDDYRGVRFYAETFDISRAPDTKYFCDLDIAGARSSFESNLRDGNYDRPSR